MLNVYYVTNDWFFFFWFFFQAVFDNMIIASSFKFKEKEMKIKHLIDIWCLKQRCIENALMYVNTRTEQPNSADLDPTVTLKRKQSNNGVYFSSVRQQFLMWLSCKINILKFQGNYRVATANSLEEFLIVSQQVKYIWRL